MKITPKSIANGCIHKYPVNILYLYNYFIQLQRKQKIDTVESRYTINFIYFL